MCQLAPQRGAAKAGRRFGKFSPAAPADRRASAIFAWASGNSPTALMIGRIAGELSSAAIASGPYLLAMAATCSTASSPPCFTADEVTRSTNSWPPFLERYSVASCVPSLPKYLIKALATEEATAGTGAQEAVAGWTIATETISSDAVTVCRRIKLIALAPD